MKSSGRGSLLVEVPAGMTKRGWFEVELPAGGFTSGALQGQPGLPVAAPPGPTGPGPAVSSLSPISSALIDTLPAAIASPFRFAEDVVGDSDARGPGLGTGSGPARFAHSPRLLMTAPHLPHFRALSAKLAFLRIAGDLLFLRRRRVLTGMFLPFLVPVAFLRLPCFDFLILMGARPFLAIRVLSA